MKICLKCKQDKEVNQFYKDKSRPDGLNPWCNTCMRQYLRIYLKTDEGKNIDRVSSKKYDKSLKGKTTRKQYEKREYVKLKDKESCFRYDKSPAGKLVDIKSNLKKYKLTIEQYDQLVIKQEGKCAICGQIPNGKGLRGKLCVDHNHVTGNVRGLLCSDCNVGIGYLKDDIFLLECALKYLKKEKK